MITAAFFHGPSQQYHFGAVPTFNSLVFGRSQEQGHVHGLLHLLQGEAHVGKVSTTVFGLGLSLVFCGQSWRERTFETGVASSECNTGVSLLWLSLDSTVCVVLSLFELW